MLEWAARQDDDAAVTRSDYDLAHLEDQTGLITPVALEALVKKYAIHGAIALGVVQVIALHSGSAGMVL